MRIESDQEGLHPRSRKNFEGKRERGEGVDGFTPDGLSLVPLNSIGILGNLLNCIEEVQRENARSCKRFRIPWKLYSPLKLTWRAQSTLQTAWCLL